MKASTGRRGIFVALLSTLIVSNVASGVEPDKISEPGRYAGYGNAAYDDLVRSSVYVSARDGTRLAIDVFRPTKSGQIEVRALPTLLSVTQYRRATKLSDGTIRYTNEMLELVKHGYVVVIADARGKGASFGTRRGPWSDDEARDAFDLIAWLAKQSWSNGKVGMFGASYLGGIQLAAAREKPPALKAIMADLIVFDVFDQFMGMVPPDGPLFDSFDEATDAATAPVDEDVDGKLLKAAIEQHRTNNVVGPMPYRDSVAASLGVDFYSEVNPSAHIKEIRKWGGAIYLLGHWSNWLIPGAVSGFANYRNPKKLTLLPGGGPPGASPRGKASFDSVAEHRRWFDYWLKGIDNGVMKEPAVFYEVANTGERKQNAKWQENAKKLELFLADGTIAEHAPDEKGSVSFTVKYDVTRGTRDSSGVQFLSNEFPVDRSIAGSVVADFEVATSAADGDFIAYLQDVAPDGKVSDVTEGRIRASQRKEHKPPFNTLGLPWHRANQADSLPMTPNKLERARFAFQPIAWEIKKGHRLKLIVTGSMPQRSQGLDMMNRTPPQDPAPVQTIAYGSRLILPVVSQ